MYGNIMEAGSRKQEARNSGNNDELKILICYHKPYTMPKNDENIFLPIHVGKKLSDLNLNMQTDCDVNGKECDNISDKNPYYCELTAMYWAWKNIKKLYPNLKYIGLYHYRRFFAFDEKEFFATRIIKTENYIKNYKIDPGKVMNILKKDYAIINSPVDLPCSISYQWPSWYKFLKDAIYDKTPDYCATFEKFFNKNKYASFNMFIMKYDDFVKCCEWLFKVMSAFDEKNPKRELRINGRLSEVVFQVWFIKNKIKCKYLNVYECLDNTDGSQKTYLRNLMWFIIRFGGWCLNNFSYRLLKFSLNVLRFARNTKGFNFVKKLKGL